MKPDSQGYYHVSSCGSADMPLDCPDCEASMSVDPWGNSVTCPACGSEIWYDWDGDTDHGWNALDVETNANPIPDEERVNLWGVPPEGSPSTRGKP